MHSAGTASNTGLPQRELLASTWGRRSRQTSRVTKLMTESLEAKIAGLVGYLEKGNQILHPQL